MDNPASYHDEDRHEYVLTAYSHHDDCASESSPGQKSYFSGAAHNAVSIPRAPAPMNGLASYDELERMINDAFDQLYAEWENEEPWAGRAGGEQKMQRFAEMLPLGLTGR